MRRILFLILLFFISNLQSFASTLIHFEDFNNCSTNTWSTIRGDDDKEISEAWSCYYDSSLSETYMVIDDSDGVDEEDWFISPAINLDLYTKEYLSFEYFNYYDTEGLELLYSTDYNGSGSSSDVSTATWNSLNLDLHDIYNDANAFNFFFQRAIDLSGISGTNVYFAFRYTSTSNPQGWIIDNIRIFTDYYSNVRTAIDGGDKCLDLKWELHDLIKGHERKPYSSTRFDVWESFYITDKRLNDAGTAYIVYDMYSDNPSGTEPYEFILGTDQDTGGGSSSEGSKYNREHSFPKSWWGGGALVADTQYTDVHFIVPSDKLVNSNKSNYPLGETTSATFTSLNGSKVGPSSHSSYSGTIYEPIDEYKGDFARMYFYVSTRYMTYASTWESNYSAALTDDSYTFFEPWLLETLLTWHENDPVSPKEIDRNNSVYSIQKNRNPFIDHPEYISYIWGTSASVGCPASIDTPVELITFEGIQINDKENSLSWATASEENTSHFVIEHSVNGIDFTAVGRVEAWGYSLDVKDYQFIHDYNNDINYYRLKIVDFDNYIDYSNIILIKNNKVFDFDLYPTVSSENINIYADNLNEFYQIEILNLNGQVVKNININNEMMTIPVNDLPNGAYIAQIKNNHQFMVKRFFVR